MVPDLEKVILLGNVHQRQTALIMLGGHCIENKEFDRGTSAINEALSMPMADNGGEIPFSTVYFTVMFAVASLNENKRKKDAKTMMGNFRKWTNREM